MEKKDALLTACDTYEDVLMEQLDKVRRLKASIDKLTSKIRVDVLEKQDELLMQAFTRIGGEQYHCITISKEKVLDAFGKYTPKLVTMTRNYKQKQLELKCPTCDNIVSIIKAPHSDISQFVPTQRIIGHHYKYCPDCGQALDWKLEDHIRECTDEKEPCTDEKED